ncbi:MAG: hypothetical protein WAW22_09725 [Smithellaceae bacterium]
MENLKIKSQVRLDADIIYSKAFKEIMSSGSAITTLMRCYQKRKWDDSRGRKKKPAYLNEPFIFPYNEMKDLWGIKTTTHWKNMNRLIEVGFLDLDYQGGWYQKNERTKDFSRYKLSERWRKYGTPEFKKVEKEKVLPESFHIRANIARKVLKATSLKRSGHLHNSEDDRLKTGNSRLHDSEVDRTGKKDAQSLAAIG